MRGIRAEAAESCRKRALSGGDDASDWIPRDADGGSDGRKALAPTGQGEDLPPYPAQERSPASTGERNLT